MKVIVLTQLSMSCPPNRGYPILAIKFGDDSDSN
jgi:hypothetical protein